MKLWVNKVGPYNNPQAGSRTESPCIIAQRQPSRVTAVALSQTPRKASHSGVTRVHIPNDVSGDGDWKHVRCKGAN